MSKVKKLFISVLSVLLIGAQSVAFASCGNETADSGSEKKTSVTEENGAPLGIYTDLQFALNGENGTVTASVKNKFTLFPSTVTVNLELYRSYDLQDSVSSMTLIASNNIYDLDQGETLSVTASTEGRQSFWKARASYKIDNKPWKESLSETVLLDKDGAKRPVSDYVPDNTIIDRKEYVSDFIQPKQVEHFAIASLFNGYHISIDSLTIKKHLNNINYGVVKNLFSGVRIGRLELEIDNDKSFEKQIFDGSYFKLLLLYSPSENVGITVNDCLKDSLGVNVFICHQKNGINQRYSAFISDETIDELVKFATEAHEEQLSKFISYEGYCISDFLHSGGEKYKLSIYPYYDPIIKELMNSGYIDDTFYPSSEGYYYLENEEDLKTVKNMFGEVKLGTVDKDKVPVPFQPGLYWGWKGKFNAFNLYINYGNGASIDINILKSPCGFYNADLFVTYNYSENGNNATKFFIALLPEGVKELLVEYTTKKSDGTMIK